MKDKDKKEIPEISDDMPKQRKLPVWAKIVIGVVAALAYYRDCLWCVQL